MSCRRKGICKQVDNHYHVEEVWVWDNYVSDQSIGLIS